MAWKKKANAGGVACPLQPCLGVPSGKEGAWLEGLCKAIAGCSSNSSSARCAMSGPNGEPHLPVGRGDEDDDGGFGDAGNLKGALSLVPIEEGRKMLDFSTFGGWTRGGWQLNV